MYYDPSLLNFPRAKENFITVYNRTVAILPACEAAFVQGWLENISPDAPCFIVDNEYNPFKIWGVPAQDIPPSSAGTMQISGVCRAFVQNGVIGDWLGAVPGRGIATDPAGTARLLHSGTATEPGLIQLGFGGGSGYDGAFKVTRSVTDPNAVHVSGGHTDLRTGWDTVEATEVAITPEDTYICFCVKRNPVDNRLYDVFITTDLNLADAIPEFTVTLAQLYFVEGKLFSITQRWMGWQGIFFGGRYML